MESAKEAKELLGELKEITDAYKAARKQDAMLVFTKDVKAGDYVRVRITQDTTGLYSITTIGDDDESPSFVEAKGIVKREKKRKAAAEKIQGGASG